MRIAREIKNETAIYIKIKPEVPLFGWRIYPGPHHHNSLLPPPLIQSTTVLEASDERSLSLATNLIKVKNFSAVNFDLPEDSVWEGSLRGRGGGY